MTDDMSSKNSNNSDIEVRVGHGILLKHTPLQLFIIKSVNWPTYIVTLHSYATVTSFCTTYDRNQLN